MPRDAYAKPKGERGAPYYTNGRSFDRSVPTAVIARRLFRRGDPDISAKLSACGLLRGFASRNDIGRSKLMAVGIRAADNDSGSILHCEAVSATAAIHNWIIGLRLDYFASLAMTLIPNERSLL
jgi:hypothetical protein